MWPSCLLAIESRTPATSPSSAESGGHPAVRESHLVRSGHPTQDPRPSSGETGLPNATKCALYVRVSTEGQTVEQQLSALYKYAQQRGYLVIGVYPERGASAWDSKAERPELARFWKDAAAEPRPFDVLIFWKLDRFSRQGLLQTANELSRLKNLGMRWESATEPMFNVDNQLVRDILLAFAASWAQHESTVRSERVRLRNAAVREGTVEGSVGGRPTRLTEEKLQKLHQLYIGGTTSKKAAQILQVPVGTIRYGLYKLRQDGRLPPYKGPADHAKRVAAVNRAPEKP
jgi:DNA invertase Pin-like site-specific DNA recombinase